MVNLGSYCEKRGGLYILGFELYCYEQCVFFLVFLSRVAALLFVFAAVQCSCGLFLVFCSRSCSSCPWSLSILQSYHVRPWEGRQGFGEGGS
jgi:hypothetical protein